MKRLVGLQLYSVRDALAADFAGTIKKLAEMGYNAVETAGVPAGMTPVDMVKIFRSNNLGLISCHAQLPVGENATQILDTVKALGGKYLLTGFGAFEPWAKLDTIKEMAEKANEAAENAAKYGIKIGLHNHDQEMQIVDGKPAYRHFLDMTVKDVIMEVDVYWVKVGKLDPVTVLNDVGDRCPVVHLKDGMGSRGTPFKPLGEGVMDIPAVLKVIGDKDGWFVEQDSGEGCMVENVKRSIQYLEKIM
ncbi:MAG: hypothetical protein A2020_14860 [Lentisphaerae bacterium GWF2_45_14]|nr:MAG: hypothetical protein A2020_14860 [Lentisphaerae bacterium GWF2_45_14]